MPVWEGRLVSLPDRDPTDRPAARANLVLQLPGQQKLALPAVGPFRLCRTCTRCSAADNAPARARPAESRKTLATILHIVVTITLPVRLSGLAPVHKHKEGPVCFRHVCSGIAADCHPLCPVSNTVNSSVGRDETQLALLPAVVSSPAATKRQSFVVIYAQRPSFA